jgi:hypothetical protein
MRAETAPSAMTFSRGSLTEFLRFLGKRSDNSMSEVTKQDVAAFRNWLTTPVSAKTVVNDDLKAHGLQERWFVFFVAIGFSS